jgi:hypothetical protein
MLFTMCRNKNTEADDLSASHGMTDAIGMRGIGDQELAGMGKG